MLASMLSFPLTQDGLEVAGDSALHRLDGGARSSWAQVH